ncbi:MAG: CHAP domain-containing protein [Chthoniobacterales bacterium]
MKKAYQYDRGRGLNVRTWPKNVKTISSETALSDPSKLRPGMVFVISTGGGSGHTGLVSRVVGNRLETIEGNTNDGGPREDIGVFRRAGRTIDRINRGFIDFAA